MPVPRHHAALLVLLVVAAAAYAVAPEGPWAPWVKPLPALCAAGVVATAGWSGRWVVVGGLVVAAAGDVLVELPATERLGTLTFVVAVLVLAVGLRRLPRTLPPAVAGGLAVAWAVASGVAVVPSLGDRAAQGLAVLAATALFLAVAGRTGVTVAAGALLVASNFTLFAVDLVVTPLPRWLVIGVYDLGLLLLAVGLRDVAVIVGRPTGGPGAVRP